mgnify:CR=1 FL=1
MQLVIHCLPQCGKAFVLCEIVQQVKVCSYAKGVLCKAVKAYKNEEEKEENDDFLNTINTLEQVCKQSGRLEIEYKITSGITLRNRFEVSDYKKSKINEVGFLAYQDLIYDPLQSKFSGNIRFAVFNTPGFDSRIYAYENDVLYSYSVLAYQHSGIRFYFNGRLQLRRDVDMWMKYSLSSYSNLDKIGSGLDEITGSHRSEIKLQFRYQF